MTKGWLDRMKDERIRWALRWFRWRFRRTNTWGKFLNSGKEKMKTLGTRIYSQEQTPKEGINHLEEIRIRFIVCLSFIKFNWWQAKDFAYYLFFLKGLRGIWRKTWESLQEPPVGLEEGMDWYDDKGKKDLNEPPVGFKMTNEREWITGRIRRTNMLEGIEGVLD